MFPASNPLAVHLINTTVYPYRLKYNKSNMGKALYRKYRSKNLSEIVGQEHITTTLSNALKKGAISHAYLFTGPRGVGKTSIARILAHEVNELAYDDSTHLDIIEIDAASNRRIDEIRDLREHVHSAPTSGKYKVYIIDEVHMLTKEAFNALLKTLEEPPEHVIFILATTESHKLPETIISRTQRFTFKPVEPDKAIEHLKHIAASENVTVEDEALALIAEHGQGSFRDSISLLDQVSSGRDHVTAEDVRLMLGVAPAAAIESLVHALETGSTSGTLNTLEKLRAEGYHAPQLAKQLAKRLRNDLLNNTGSLDTSIITDLLKNLIDVPASHDPGIALELTLLSASTHAMRQQHLTAKTPNTVTEPAAKTTAIQNTSNVSAATDKSTAETPEEAKDPRTELAEETARSTETVELTKHETLLDENTWQEALLQLKKRHNTLYGVARMASPSFSDNTVTLVFKFKFHQKRLDDAKNKKVLADIFTSLLKSPVQVVCLLDETGGNKIDKPPKQEKNANLDTISNIFGSAEVLE